MKILMPPSSSFSVKNCRRFDDALNLALRQVDDFQHGPWWLRCIEFHFRSGIYKAGDSFDWHCHREIQLEIPLSGDFEFSLQGEEAVQVQAGNIFTIPPEFQHRWKCLQSGMMLGVLLVVTPKPDALFFPVAPRLIKGASASPLSAALMAGLMDEFVRSRNVPKISTHRLAAWIYLIVDQLINGVLRVPTTETPEESPSRLSRNQRVASTLMRYIEANISGDLSIRVLEQVVGLSGRQIQRLFVETTGRNCHQYIMNRRIEVAQALMTRQPHISIKEIAYACGFSSPAHFATNFKKSTGVSPSDYSL